MGWLGLRRVNALVIGCYDGCTTYTVDMCTKWHPVSLDEKQLMLAKKKNFSNDIEPSVFAASEQNFSLTFHRRILPLLHNTTVSHHPLTGLLLLNSLAR